MDNFTKSCYFCEKWRVSMEPTIEAMVKNRIIEHGPGWCFTPMHFLDLGSSVSIRKALLSFKNKKLFDA